MSTPDRPMSETERILLQEFPDPDSQAHISLCFGEVRRAADAQQAIDRADLAALGQGRCPASLLAPFRARR